jgi:hypothetical protein
MAFPLAGISSFEALFAPSADLWPRWQAHDPTSTATIDHGRWQRLLETHIRADGDGLNRFDYRGPGAAERESLEAYIAELAGLPIDGYDRAEQAAFWINLYNALTVRVILEHYPVESIRDIDISPGLFADGPWDKKLVSVAGEALTLNDIEHRILRPIWNDPRIHYAVNCASIGCPNLQRMAFTGSNLQDLLETAARDYVNSPRGARLENNGLHVSSIYVWFQEDFGGDDSGVIAHLARYAEPGLAARLEGIGALADHDYDWSLNDTGGAASN